MVTLLIAAYNEESIIYKKLKSVINTNYPIEKIQIIVGSDASTDATNSIVTSFKDEFKNIELINFEGRTGKINIINHLQTFVKTDIVILNDANVLFQPDTLFELVKYFKDDKVGLIAANIIKQSPLTEGIVAQEVAYIDLENKIKLAESNAWQAIMGAEGGCFAMRTTSFKLVPRNFIVDDFFLTFEVIKLKKYTLFNSNAICNEDVFDDKKAEYRRKVRISAGNFQNLNYFKAMLLPFWTGTAFAFLSHKVLRWLTPFFLIICLISSLALAGYSELFFWLFICQIIYISLPFIDKVIPIKLKPLNFVSHFYLMNFALLKGFFNYAKGVKSNVWQPVKRNI
ncbi:MAG: glycosyltransferase [Bacteroidota bacterium]|nr:glycosyltransferase [Bacteroidota bacterium]